MRSELSALEEKALSNEQVCFGCNRLVEKALKSARVHFNLDIINTHNLVLLGRDLESSVPGLRAIEGDLALVYCYYRLVGFPVKTQFSVDYLDASKALGLCRKVIDLISNSGVML